MKNTAYSQVNPYGELNLSHHKMSLSSGIMNYIDQGTGPTVLMVHGTPSWSFLFRHMVSTLSSSYRCIAPDHLGFGLSEKNPSFPGTPEWHTYNLLELIDRLNLNNITLIVHDFGGPIGLGFANMRPHLIKRIIIMNSWCWATAGRKDVERVNKIVNSPIGRFLYLNLNFSARLLIKQGFADKKKLKKNVHNAYINIFPDRDSRFGPLALAKALKGSSSWFETQWTLLPQFKNTPVDILWGVRDKFFGIDSLNRWIEMFPHAQVQKIEAGHFLQEEAIAQVNASLKSIL